MPNYHDLIDQLNELEKDIAQKAANLSKCKYAFTVIMTENSYSLLCDAYKNTEFLHKPFQFPWCHVKLLTETCARYLTHEDHKPESTIASNLGVPRLYKGYWTTFPKLLKYLNLAATREKGGPWCVYANVILHAGITPRYFESLLEKAQKIYKSYYGNEQRAIQELLYSDNLLDDPHYSKYFKLAFKEPTERKLLCHWLIWICRITSDLKCVDNLPDIPSSLAYIIRHNAASSRPLVNSKPMKLSQPYFIFNDEEGHIEFHLSQDFAFTVEQASSFTIDDITPTHWVKPLKEAVNFGKSSLRLPILPDDLGKQYSCYLHGRREIGYIISRSNFYLCP